MIFLKKYVNWESATVFFIALLIADTIIGGPIGLLFRGERHLLLVMIVIAGGGLCFSRWRDTDTACEPIQKRFLWPLGFFLISLIWILLIPLLITGGVFMALRDAQSLVMLPIVTMLLFAIVNLGILVKRLLKVVVIFSMCLAIFQVACWFWLELRPTSTEIYYPILATIFNTTQSIFVGWHSAPGGGYVRVIWVSSIWLVVAIFVAPLVVDRKWLFFVELFIGMAIYVSYTRGIWLGVLVGVLLCTIANYVVLVLSRRSAFPIKNWGIVLSGLMCAVLVISSVDFVARGQFGFLSRMVDFSTVEVSGNEDDGEHSKFAKPLVDESVSERKIQADLLLLKWSERPWMGWGYGAYISDHFRDDQAPYSYEMLPFALLMKLGVIGLAIYLAFWAGLILDVFKRTSPELSILYSGGLSTFLLASHTNPFFFNFAGISIVMFFLLWWASLKNE